jgi:2'-5' RNA ligase
MEECKRLFIAMETQAPWPEEYPGGRILLESNRHLTLAFLGNISLPVIEKLLSTFPKPPFSLGLAGMFSKPLFLSNVAAWQIDWWEQETELFEYRQAIVSWLEKIPIPIKGEFLSHVTIARQPTEQEEWRRSFTPLPCFAKDVVLFQSLGHSTYRPLWKIPLLAPFEPVEHMADIAFVIRGHDLEQLYTHAWLALSFFEPILCAYFVPAKPNSLRELIECLNKQIARVDIEVGCPLKAVSHHGTLQGKGNSIEWEMIADV